MEELRRKLLISLVMITSIVAFGTVGYMNIEGWSFLDSIYMTIITLASVGYKEVKELSENGRIFTIFLIIGGVGTVLYALNNGAKIILEGEIKEIFGRSRLEKRMREMKGHYIICGYGRMGKIICRELKSKHIKHVVIEKSPEVNLPEKEDILLLPGDATKDEVLKEAGVERAKGLISVLPTDAENLYVVLSARELNPDLFIVARAGEEGS
ncbi:MAG: potassium channel family protein, partial [Thermodesulfovibrionales bacterium]